MANSGNLSIALALAFSTYAVFALFIGAKFGRRELVKSGERAVYAVFFFTTVAVFALVSLLLRNDFSIEYVAGYSNRDLPMFYKAAALWGGQKGSLLFWSWILTLYGAIAAWRNRRLPGKLVPYTLGVLCITATFFLVLNRFPANPFDRLVAEHGGGTPIPYAPPDGRGLNPLLQHPAMVIHPPLLYLGFVGFVVPFAFCLGALLTRELGSAWIKLARRWTLTAWLFLGAGIILGGRWAYVELGWGGYWAWDPVENASLLPWLAGTAFLHSVIVQERKNMLKVWNVVLIITTYLLAVFGTFLTRSGIVSSVHAFAQSSIGTYFVVFLALMGALSLYLVVSRLRFLRSENQLDSYASREASFLFNNLVLLAACFAVLWGTIFPVISEMIQGEQITVGAPFFNKINVPIGLFLLFLTGVGPLLAWRKTSMESMLRIFIVPTSVGIVAAAVTFASGVRSIYPLVSFGLSGFVVATIVAEFSRAARARARNTGQRFLAAVVAVTSINRRRYGGYIVHFGFVLLVIGITGQAFTTEGWGEGQVGDRFSVGHYDFEVLGIENLDDPNFVGMSASLAVSRNDRRVATLSPERRFYHASEQTTSEVRMHHTLREDVYLVFAGMNEDTDKAVFQVWVNPLVGWVWIGSVVMGLGTVVTILPGRRARRARRHTRDVDRLLREREVVA